MQLPRLRYLTDGYDDLLNLKSDLAFLIDLKSEGAWG